MQNHDQGQRKTVVFTKYPKNFVHGIELLKTDIDLQCGSSQTTDQSLLELGSKTLILCKCPSNVVQLTKTHEINLILRCKPDKNALRSFSALNLAFHPSFDETTYIIGPKLMPLSVEQLKSSKKVIFFNVNPEIFKMVPFEQLESQIDVEVEETQMRHLDLHYLQQFDLNIMRSSIGDSFRVEKSLFDIQGDTLTLMGDVQQFQQNQWFKTSFNKFKRFEIRCKLSEKSVQEIQKNVNSLVEVNFQKPQTAMETLSQFGFNVSLGQTPFQRKTWQESDFEMQVLPGYSGDFLMKPAIGQIKKFTFVNADLEQFLSGDYKKLSGAEIENANVGAHEVKLLRKAGFVVQRVNNIRFGEESPQDVLEMLSTVQFSEVTLKKFPKICQNEKLLRLLALKTLNLEFPLSWKECGEISNRLIKLRVQGVEQLQRLKLAGDQLILQRGYSIKHLITMDIWKNIRTIKFAASANAFLDDNPPIFAKEVVVKGFNQDFSDFQLTSVRNLNCRFEFLDDLQSDLPVLTDEELSYEQVQNKVYEDIQQNAIANTADNVQAKKVGWDKFMQLNQDLEDEIQQLEKQFADESIIKVVDSIGPDLQKDVLLLKNEVFAETAVLLTTGCQVMIGYGVENENLMRKVKTLAEIMQIVASRRARHLSCGEDLENPDLEWAKYLYICKYYQAKARSIGQKIVEIFCLQ